MKIDHGSNRAQIIIGILSAFLLNGGLGVAILIASHAKQEVVAATLDEDPEAEIFQCRYFEDGRLHQLEVGAQSWQQAEVEVCGAELRDLRLPPLLFRGQVALGVNPDDNALLKAQRESCSCNQGEAVPILEDIGIVQAPKLGDPAQAKGLAADLQPSAQGRTQRGEPRGRAQEG